MKKNRVNGIQERSSLACFFKK